MTIKEEAGNYLSKLRGLAESLVVSLEAIAAAELPSALCYDEGGRDVPYPSFVRSVAARAQRILIQPINRLADLLSRDAIQFDQAVQVAPLAARIERAASGFAERRYHDVSAPLERALAERHNLPLEKVRKILDESPIDSMPEPLRQHARLLRKLLDCAFDLEECAGDMNEWAGAGNPVEWFVRIVDAWGAEIRRRTLLPAKHPMHVLAAEVGREVFRLDQPFPFGGDAVAQSD